MFKFIFTSISILKFINFNIYICVLISTRAAETEEEKEEEDEEVDEEEREAVRDVLYELNS